MDLTVVESRGNPKDGDYGSAVGVGEIVMKSCCWVISLLCCCIASNYGKMMDI